MAFLSVCSVIVANVSSTLIGYRIQKSIPEKPEAVRREALQEEEEAPDLEEVSERNLFAARRERVSLTDEEMEGERGEPGRWQDAVRSSLPLKLVSTMVFKDPFESRAVIMSLASGQSSVYSIGECTPYKKTNSRSMETYLESEAWQPERHCNEVEGMAIVKRIEEFRVVILNERDNRYEYLSLLEEERMPMRFPGPMHEEEDEGGGVKKVGANSYQIEQGEFDKALSNVARLMTEARAVPEMDGSGNTVGFKIVYIKSDSLFEKIGIERMDVLTRINGYELNTPEKALQLFSKLKTASQFTIDINRDGKPVTLDYTVVR